MQISRKEFKELLRSVGKDELKSMLKEILEEEGELKVGKQTAYIRNDEVHISADTPKCHLEGTETGAKNLSLRENAGIIDIYDEGAAAAQDKLLDSIPKRLQSVKRDRNGAVAFTNIGTLSITQTATGSWTTATSDTLPISFTKCILKLAGAFTTAKAVVLRNGSALATLTATGDNNRLWLEPWPYRNK